MSPTKKGLWPLRNSTNFSRIPPSLGIPLRNNWFESCFGSPSLKPTTASSFIYKKGIVNVPQLCLLVHVTSKHRYTPTPNHFFWIYPPSLKSIWASFVTIRTPSNYKTNIQHRPRHYSYKPTYPGALQVDLVHKVILTKLRKSSKWDVCNPLDSVF